MSYLVTEVKEAILYKLKEIYGEGSTELNRFRVLVLTGKKQPLLGTRAQYDYDILIHYMSEQGEDSNTKCCRTGAIIMDNVEFIIGKTGNIYRGKNLHYEIKEGELNFYISYSEIVNRYVKEEVMEEINLI